MLGAGSKEESLPCRLVVLVSVVSARLCCVTVGPSGKGAAALFSGGDIYSDESDRDLESCTLMLSVGDAALLL